ncbi:MAG TPA: hypothetical protein VM557_12960 [Thermoanaerobaculia bacterium]|nr:hypothetical protein [Thermoanaerobaculia bacterium]
MKTRCQQWIDDPENHEAHLLECDSCRTRAEELSQVDRSLSASVVEPGGSIASLVTDRLPVATWEGARHRAWGLTLLVIALITLLTAGLFAWVGIPPAEGIADSAQSAYGGPESAALLSDSVGAFLRNAPRSFHAMILLAFLTVNFILLALLRRPPRGYDVRSR